MTHLGRALEHLDVAAAHLRISIDGGELTPVDAVITESLLAGWKRDRAVLAHTIDKGATP